MFGFLGEACRGLIFYFVSLQSWIAGYEIEYEDRFMDSVLRILQAAAFWWCYSSG